KSPRKIARCIDVRFALSELRALERDSRGRFSFKFGVDQVLWHFGCCQLEQKKPSVGDDRYRFHTSRCSVVLLSTETRPPVFRPRGVDSTEFIGIRFTPINLSEIAPLKKQCFDARFFFRMIEDKTVGRVDPSMHSRALNHCVRLAGARLAPRSALFPPHLQGSVPVTRAMIPRTATPEIETI